MVVTAHGCDLAAEVAPGAARQDHHHLPVSDVVLLLETDPAAGLSQGEAHERLLRFGRNVLPHVQRHGPLVRFLLQFHNPLIYILLVAGVVTAALGEPVDALVILGVVVVNAAVGFVQEARAERALEALQSIVRTIALVIRDGQRVAIDSSRLVPGDLVVLTAGDKVPADLRLLDVDELRIDESALTGESMPVDKSATPVQRDTVLAERVSMAYSGSLVVAGSGQGMVVATGADTELGVVHRLVGATTELATPLTRRIGQFSRWLTVAILGLAVFTLVIGVARGESASEMIAAAVALAVGAIPEGLPAVVTITLAIGVRRMARRHAIIRRLPAVETLGSTTVVCTDKTGTLTENEMTVLVVVAGTRTFELTGTGYALDGRVMEHGEPVTLDEEPALLACLEGAVLCNDAAIQESGQAVTIVGDPTEAALLVAARKSGLDLDDTVRASPRVDTLGFESSNRYMATAHRGEDDGVAVILKGAVETVVDLCGDQVGPDGRVETLDASAVLAGARQLADRALRVLAVAREPRSTAALPLEHDEVERRSFTFLGLVAMADPPRPDAIAAVHTCHEAGVAVKMITGDHAATARAVARGVGITDARAGPNGADRLMTGLEIAEAGSSDLAAATNRTNVFARVSPEQKLRLVEALQAQGHVVAMTGDGINDAPALKQADIGVAMGQEGTEVAKEAADMVLTDDDFASIEAAIEEGRTVFDNLTKFVVWALPTSMGEGLVILAAIIAATALPILPVQVLWVNMITAVALGLTLAVEAAEPGIMHRPPRDPRQPLLTRALVGRIVLVSVIMVTAAFWLFQWEQDRGASIAEARTVAVNVFVLVEIAYLLNCRSLERSMLQVGIFSNRWLGAGIAITLALQVLFTYAPFMHTLFHSASIDLDAWLRVVGAAMVGYGIVGLDKWVRRRTALSPLA